MGQTCFMECTVYKTDENKNGIDLATTFKSFNYYDRTCSFIVRKCRKYF